MVGEGERISADIDAVLEDTSETRKSRHETAQGRAGRTGERKPMCAETGTGQLLPRIQPKYIATHKSRVKFPETERNHCSYFSLLKQNRDSSDSSLQLRLKQRSFGGHARTGG